MTNNKNLDKLAYQLFKVFSRTEYALKASGFNRGDGDAKADWRAFALNIETMTVLIYVRRVRDNERHYPPMVDTKSQVVDIQLKHSDAG